MIKVVLCDDHAMLRRGVRDTLAEATVVRVIGEVDGYPGLRELLRLQRPDVLLLDVDMPGRSGLEILAVLQQEEAPLRTLMFSMYPVDQYALRCLKAGAMGYLNKGGDPAALITAVRTVAQGRKYLPPEVAELLANHLSAPESAQLHDSLSERELQTLRKIASGKKLAQIAQELMISPKTVSVYRARALEKLGLSNNAELTVYAIRNQLV
ncbi:MAG: LuxR family transcriptional regulator [Comamonadaceae bacterium BICA1-1]|nr:MAG: LuxR family transcriptional regulator [Comamonadaceae bacterium BICA1-1]